MEGGGSSSTREGADGWRVIAGGVYFGEGVVEFFVLEVDFFLVLDGGALEEPIRLVGGIAGDAPCGAGGVS